MRIHTACFVLLILSFTGLCEAQSTPNTLLWRIQRKGDPRVSYVYGTMHLTDKRVFQLGDSVYKALETTEGFAAELDMDRMGTVMINHILADKEEKKSQEPELLKNKLDKETWQLYKDKLAAKLGIKADKITVDDLDKIDSDLQRDLFRSGEMPTFLDAWLFGKARRLGKWVGGIEDFEDQLNIVDGLEDKIRQALFEDNYFRNDLNHMVRIYEAQQLDSLDAMFYREGSEKDYLLVKRNVKMSRRIDSLMQFRSTMFAVGAAHLPGDSGLISLLRNRGLTVTPVISNKKLSADKYVLKKEDNLWIPVKVTDSAYGLSMPGIADNLKVLEELGVDAKLFFDLAYLRMYMTMSGELSPGRRNLGADSLYGALKEQYSSKGTLLKENTVSINGSEGREYKWKIEEGTMQMQIFLPGMERIVLNFVFSLGDKQSNDGDVQKFFNSFVANNNVHITPRKEEKDWSQIKDGYGSFTIEMPGKPKFTKDVKSDADKVALNYQYIDMSSQVFYSASAFKMKEGKYSAVSKRSFEDLKNNLKAQGKDSKVIDSADLSFDGYPGYKCTVSTISNGTPLEITCDYVLRGNITYYVFVVYEMNEKNRIARDRFFASFHLLPIDHPSGHKIISTDGSFSTTSAFGIHEEILEEKQMAGVKRFATFDTASSTTMYVERLPLPGWFWWSSDTAFLKRLVTTRDTTQKLQYTLSHGSDKTSILDYSVASDELNLLKGKMVLSGNTLYKLYGYFAPQDIPVYSSFFDDFKVVDEMPVADLSKNGLDKLAAVMETSDSAGIKEIEEWWKLLSFSKEDLPLLFKIGLRLYADYDSGYRTNINKQIFDAIESVDSLHTGIDLVRADFPGIGKKDELVKPYIYSYLSKIHTAESYALLKKCLLEYPIPEKELPYFQVRFYDSLQLTASLFPEVLRLAGSASLWDIITELTNTLNKDELLSLANIKTYEKEFIRTARRILKKNKDELNEGGYYYTELVKVLGLLNSTESNGIIREFAKLDSREMKYVTLLALLKNKQPIDQRTIYTLATTDEYRSRLYDELVKLNKISLFPPGYATQMALGRSKLFNLDSEEDQPETMEFIGERTRDYNGKKQKFYLFKVKYSEDGDGYLGVAGPYELNAKILSSDQTATGIYFDKSFDGTKADEFFTKYIDDLLRSKTSEAPPAQEKIKE